MRKNIRHQSTVSIVFLDDLIKNLNHFEDYIYSYKDKKLISSFYREVTSIIQSAKSEIDLVNSIYIKSSILNINRSIITKDWNRNKKNDSELNKYTENIRECFLSDFFSASYIKAYELEILRDPKKALAYLIQISRCGNSIINNKTKDDLIEQAKNQIFIEEYNLPSIIDQVKDILLNDNIYNLPLTEIFKPLNEFKIGIIYNYIIQHELIPENIVPIFNAIDGLDLINNDHLDDFMYNYTDLGIFIGKFLNIPTFSREEVFNNSVITQGKKLESRVEDHKEKISKILNLDIY